MPYTPLFPAHKFAPPTPPADYVSRPHLIEALHQAFAASVVLVTAPSGYGKTTAVADALKQSHKHVWWISLERDDDDPNRFAQAVLYALYGAGLPFTGSTPTVDYLAHVLSNELDASTPTVLVLDDVHVITDPTIHAMIAALITLEIPSLCVILMSHTTPPLSLARARLRGKVADIHIDHLRLRNDEAETYLTRAMAKIDTRATQRIIRQAEGWIAGIKLLALSRWQGESYTADYLLEEIFAHQPPDLQAFLLETALLDQFCAPLCDALRQANDSQELIDRLYKANLFIFALDETRKWYRYHPLLIDMLRRHVQPTDDRLHRAARWFESEGSIRTAIQYALEGRDYAHAAAMLTQHAQSFSAGGDLTSLFGWAERLPRDLVAAAPQLCLVLALPQIVTGKLAAGQAYLDLAEAALAENPDQQLRGDWLTQRALVTLLSGDPSSADALAASALALLPPWALYAPIANMVRGIVAFTFTHLNDALRWLSAGYEGAQRLQEPALISQALGLTAQIHIMRGETERAERLYQETLAAHAALPSLPAAMRAYEGISWIALLRGDLDRAFQHAAQVIAHTEAYGLVNYRLPALLYGARILALRARSSSSRSDAQAMLHDAEALTMQHPNVPGVNAQAALIRCSLMLGDVKNAQKWLTTVVLDERFFLDCPDALLWLRLEEALSCAWVWLMTGQEQQAAQLLEKLEPLTRAVGAVLALIDILILKSLLPRPNAEALHEALTHAAAAGFHWPFMEKGDVLIPALRKSKHPFAADLLRQMVAFPQEPQMVEALTTREKELLGLVATGLSNQQIADHLVMSISTVKWHLNNLYGKLGAARRTEALVRAKGMGLL